jgi:glycosyltransferase involved in cell wall biosynthesis
MREHEVVSVHLPQFEGWLLALLGRFITPRPVVLTYHCDLEFPPTPLRPLANWLVRGAHHLAGRWADRIVAYTQDYAAHSPFLLGFRDKVEVIPPPVVMPPVEEGARERLREELGLGQEVVLGFAARFAAEKGVEYLMGAIPHLAQRFPEVKVLLAGEYREVIGESHFDRLSSLIGEFGQHLIFLGAVPPARMGEFFAACDCLVVASTNSTESFGLVQVEAMLCGTPVVATNLPGVRQPVGMTGMGEVVPPRDERALAQAIVKVVEGGGSYRRPRSEIQAIFDPRRTVEAYEELFRRLRAG